MFFRTRRLLRQLSTGDTAFKAAMAGDVAVPVVVLDQLAQDMSIDVRLEVVGNPRTSMDTLYLLSHDDAQPVRGAALTRLLELSGVTDASGAAWEMTSSLQLVASIAEDLGWRDRQELCGTAFGSPEPRPGVLAELAKVQNSRVRAEVASSEFALPAILALLAADPDISVRAAVGRNTSTPADALMTLVGDVSDYVWTGVLGNTSLPGSALFTVEADTRSIVRQHLATLNVAPADILSRLAKDTSPGVRRAVASNPNTVDPTIVELATDPDVEVRRAVALGAEAVVLEGTRTATRDYARDTPVEALLILAADAAAEVRQAAAGAWNLRKEELLKLAADADPKVRRKVASNFRLPLEAFVALADDPDKYVREPIAGRIMQHGHNWEQGNGKEDGDFYIRALTLLAGSSHVDIRKEVAQHPLIPVPLLAQLLDDNLVFDQDEAVTRKLSPGHVLYDRTWYTTDEWRALALVSNPQARQTIATLKNTPKGVLAFLASDDDEDVRMSLLRNEELPATVLRKLVDDPSPSVSARAASFLERHGSRFGSDLGAFLDSNNPQARETLAREQTANVEWLESLALDPSVGVRVAVAGNPNTPPASFVSLSKDSDLDVVQAVAEALRCGHISPGALDAVAMSPHTKIRVAVAAMSGLSQETLRLLVQDSEESVRLAAARNGHTSVAALIAVIATDDLNKKYGIGQTSVAALCALARDETLAVDSLHALAQSPFAEVRLSVVKNAAVSKAILANLTRDNCPQVREAVGAHCDTPKEGLMALTNDASAEVRRAVAANPATSSEALASLDRDPDGEVALAVALHPNTPPSSLDALVEVHDRPRTNEGTSLALKMLIQGKLNRLPWVHELPARLTRSDNMWHQGVRQAVASNPLASPNSLETLSQQPDTVAFVAGNLSTPAATLSRLVRHEDKLVREALASNPNLSEAELAILSLDQHDAVRKCVADNPRTAIHTLEILANDFSPENKVVARSALSARTPAADR